MKLRRKIINAQENKVFELMKVHEPHFYPSWHFHPEYEIMLVQKGAGMRFVGDSIERFQEGDLVFYGANIPHLYRSDTEYYEKESDLLSQAIVVYFRENFLGQSFWNLSEAAPIKKLLSLSKRGIKFKGKVKTKLKNKIQNLDDRKEGIEKIIDLLSILKTMAEIQEYELLSSRSFTKHIGEKDYERINKVYQFILDNYADDPSLEEVSEIAHLSPTAFCRYFKKRTNKTYSQFLNEIKIGNACKLLIEKELSISQICFESGYNTFTHFNNQFKKITGLTPSEYQLKLHNPYFPKGD